MKILIVDDMHDALRDLIHGLSLLYTNGKPVTPIPIMRRIVIASPSLSKESKLPTFVGKSNGFKSAIGNQNRRPVFRNRCFVSRK